VARRLCRTAAASVVKNATAWPRQKPSVCHFCAMPRQNTAPEYRLTSLSEANRGTRAPKEFAVRINHLGNNNDSLTQRNAMDLSERRKSVANIVISQELRRPRTEELSRVEATISHVTCLGVSNVQTWARTMYFPLRDIGRFRLNTIQDLSRLPSESSDSSWIVLQIHQPIAPCCNVYSVYSPPIST
jgi:hypothetical protein